MRMERTGRAPDRSNELIMDHATSLLSPPEGRSTFPLILTLDMHGIPHRWITWQHACYYYTKERIAWSLGETAFTIYGGISRLSGLRSQISAASIIAIKGKAMAIRAFNNVPPLNNRELFHRDRHLCAYCGDVFGSTRLTRDHITPFSRGGRDAWMNVVTACRSCNERKSDRTPEQAGMELLYAPYVPNRAEYLILTNRRILADQMQFLAQHVPAQSRLRDSM
jgi:hypothetical protein